jgi:hypothetical protein
VYANNQKKQPCLWVTSSYQYLLPEYTKNINRFEERFTTFLSECIMILKETIGNYVQKF